MHHAAGASRRARDARVPGLRLAGSSMLPQLAPGPREGQARGSRALRHAHQASQASSTASRAPRATACSCRSMARSPAAATGAVRPQRRRSPWPNASGGVSGAMLTGHAASAASRPDAVASFMRRQRDGGQRSRCVDELVVDGEPAPAPRIGLDARRPRSSQSPTRAGGGSASRLSARPACSQQHALRQHVAQHMAEAARLLDGGGNRGICGRRPGRRSERGRCRRPARAASSAARTAFMPPPPGNSATAPRRRSGRADRRAACRAHRTASLQLGAPRRDRSRHRARSDSRIHRLRRTPVSASLHGDQRTPSPGGSVSAGSQTTSGTTQAGASRSSTRAERSTGQWKSETRNTRPRAADQARRAAPQPQSSCVPAMPRGRAAVAQRARHHAADAAAVARRHEQVVARRVIERQHAQRVADAERAVAQRLDEIGHHIELARCRRRSASRPTRPPSRARAPPRAAGARAPASRRGRRAGSRAGRAGADRAGRTGAVCATNSCPAAQARGRAARPGASRATRRGSR